MCVIEWNLRSRGASSKAGARKVHSLDLLLELIEGRVCTEQNNHVSSRESNSFQEPSPNQYQMPSASVAAVQNGCWHARG